LGRIIEALATAHDAAVQMIDTSIVRVHLAKHTSPTCWKLLSRLKSASMLLADRGSETTERFGQYFEGDAPLSNDIRALCLLEGALQYLSE
jgi:hypothetical protein